MSNPYFRNSFDLTNPEYKLINDATDEIVEIFGVDFIFLPRRYEKLDHLWGEDVLSYFDSNFPLTLFIENYSSFDGQGDLFSKFGFQLDDQLTLIIQQERFKSEVNEEPEVEDLFYHPNSGKIFQVNHVETEDGHYQFGGGLTMYKFICTLFESSHEDFETGNDEIDTRFNDFTNNSDAEETQVNSEQQDVLNFSEKDPFGNL